MQLKSLYESRRSRREVYDSKLQRYRAGAESVDNLLQSFRSLVDTDLNYHGAVNDYFDNIRDLDDLCGVYFEKLGLEVQ